MKKTQKGGSPKLYKKDDLIGESDHIRKVKARIGQCCSLNDAVLIIGERGTGKELIAQALHSEGSRSDDNFSPVNCPDFIGDPQAAQAELFGYKKGAFTGADDDREGMLEAAGAGTLFLDEIGNLPRELQTKLNRVLETKKVRRRGEHVDRPVDCRIIAATNKVGKVGERQYGLNPDLFDRFPIKIKTEPLKKRPTDRIALFLHFLRESWPKGRRLPSAHSFQAVYDLLWCEWEGNVRQLLYATKEYARRLCSPEGIWGFLPFAAPLVSEEDDLNDIDGREWADSGLKTGPLLWRSACSISTESLSRWNAQLCSREGRFDFDFAAERLEFVVRQLKRQETMIEKKIAQLQSKPEISESYKLLIRIWTVSRGYTERHNVLSQTAHPIGERQATRASGLSPGEVLVPNPPPHDRRELADKHVFTASFDESVDSLVTRFVHDVYHRCGMSKTKAAKSLGIGRDTVRKWLRKHRANLANRTGTS